MKLEFKNPRWLRSLHVLVVQTLCKCAYCGGPIGQDKGPPDGWKLEDGRRVCQKCCVEDFGKVVRKTIWKSKQHNAKHEPPRAANRKA